MLVGRASELAELDEQIARRRAVCVLGEAGVGKTALLRESAARSGRPAFEGGGLSALSWMPHLPLARAVRCGVPEGDAARVATFVADQVDDGVLIVDDLQWADSDTVESLPFLIGRVAVLAALRRGDPATAARLEQARSAGFSVRELDSLDEPEAVALVRTTRPDLADEVVMRVVERAAGNPLLLEQLALGGSDERLHLGLAARLRPHGPAVWEAVARLALLGRPAEHELVGEPLDELLEAGLVVERDRRIELRHDLLGETAVREVGAGTVRSLHSELACRLADPGEAARHHAGAGEREAAHRKALSAARRSTRASERAQHLRLAAEFADGPDADDLRMRAAAELAEAAEHRAALDLVGAVDVDAHPELMSRVALVRARAHSHLGEGALAEAAAAEGLEQAGGTGTAVEVLLRLEQARIATWDMELDRALHCAGAALSLARAIGAQEARAELVLSAALMTACSPECIEHGRAALALAGLEDDGSLELEAASLLAAAYHNLGRTDAAYRLAAETIDTARRLGLRAREVEFGHHLAHYDLHTRGDLALAIAEHRELLTDPAVLGEALVRTRANLALALAQSGDDGAARRTLDQARNDATNVDARVYVAFVDVESHWLAGRPFDALAAVKRCQGERTSLSPYVDLTGGWAAIDVGRPVPAPIDDAPIPLLAGSVPESQGLACLASGDSDKAEELLVTASTLYEGLVAFAELRCLWGAAVAALRVGALQRARERLLGVEARAQRHGYRPLLARVRPALRQTGVRRTAGRQPGASGLTSREREVLELVARGLSSREIGTRIGVEAATVDSQVKSAMRKLGVRSRARAALSVAGDGR